MATSDDALPEPVAWGLSSGYMPGCILSATTDREARTWTDWEPLFTADQLRAAIARERESMNELRRAVAELVGEDQETWPDHGNAPLAIGATVASLHAWCERAEAEISTLRQQLAEAVRDAERLRWIAAHCRSTAEHWGGRWSIVVEGPAPKRHDEEDAFYEAIDAAIERAVRGQE